MIRNFRHHRGNKSRTFSKPTKLFTYEQTDRNRNKNYS